MSCRTVCRFFGIAYTSSLSVGPGEYASCPECIEAVDGTGDDSKTMDLSTFLVEEKARPKTEL